MRKACTQQSPRPALMHLWAVAAAAWPLVLGACTSRTEEPPQAAASAPALSTSAPAPLERPYHNHNRGARIAWAGELDVDSHYPSVVMVETSGPNKVGTPRSCSGVLLGPRLVLTAGHCVCARRSLNAPGHGGKSIIDSTHCAKNASVTTMVTDPGAPSGGVDKAYLHHTYEAVEVRPHPELKLLMDEQGGVESSKANLALILLGKPVQAAFSPPALTDTESRAGESFLTVSFIDDETVGGTYGRCINRYKALKALPPDRTEFDHPLKSVFKGDSGGPCLRPGTAGPVLIGVSARGLGEVPTFTSTYAYRDWLRSEVAAAAAME